MAIAQAEPAVLVKPALEEERTIDELTDTQQSIALLSSELNRAMTPEIEAPAAVRDDRALLLAGYERQNRLLLEMITREREEASHLACMWEASWRANSSARSLVRTLAGSRSIRLAAAVSRFRNQFLRGNRQEKASFIKSLFSGKRNEAVFQPLNEVVRLLDEAPPYYPIPPREGELDFHLQKEKLRLVQFLRGPLSRKAQSIRQALANREFRDILIFPHSMFWDPSQPVGRLMQAFASQGWLCFFCESPDMEDNFGEIEPNLFLTPEADLLQALGDTHATVLLTWLGSWSFVSLLHNRSVLYHVGQKLEDFPYYGASYLSLHSRLASESEAVSYATEELRYEAEGRGDALYLPVLLDQPFSLEPDEDWTERAQTLARQLAEVDDPGKPGVYDRYDVIAMPGRDVESRRIIRSVAEQLAGLGHRIFSVGSGLAGAGLDNWVPVTVTRAGGREELDILVRGRNIRDAVILGGTPERIAEHLRSRYGFFRFPDCSEISRETARETSEAIRARIPHVSVIVLTYNGAAYSKKCVESILNATAYPNYELIIVDNASTDSTRDWLKELGESGDPRIKIILNNWNTGYAAGNNIGFRASSGQYIVLLNNDTVVTKGWLTGLVKHMEADGKIGMCGPVTNAIGNEAKVPTDYLSLAGLERFAHIYTFEHMGDVYDDPNVLAMFCVIIRRDLYESAGGLDEGYERGMFEDDDFSEKTKQAGYRMCIAEDSFVHHFMSVSFGRLQADEFRRLIETNKKRYELKWNKAWVPHRYRIGAWQTNPEISLEGNAAG